MTTATTALTRTGAVHVTELRTRIDALRARYTLSPYSYTNTVVAGATLIKAVDVLEMRSALRDAYVAAGLLAPVYSTAPAVGAIIRVTDIAELRAAVQALE